MSSSSSSIPTKPLFNQYACIRCRRLKKKCSKHLPKCKNCDKQNESCEYVERKNKRKSLLLLNDDSSTLKKIRTNSNSISDISDNDNDNDNDKDNDIDNDDESIGDNTPSILINNLPIHHNSSNDTNSFLLSPRSSTTSNSNSISILNNPNVYNQSLLSPKQSPLPIQLPPIRNTSISLSNNDYLPPLSSYSLQPLDHLSSSKPLLNNPHNLTPSFSNAFLSPSYSIRTRSNSIKSSTSPTNNTFNIPSPKLFNFQNTNNNQFNSIEFSNNSNNNNNNNNNNPNNSIEFDLLILISTKLQLIDENKTNSNNHFNLQIHRYESTFNFTLNFLIYLDSRFLIDKFQNFKNNPNTLNDLTDLSLDDYFNTIEFLLLLTCSILISNNQNFTSPSPSSIEKLIFTIAYKLLQKKLHPLSNIQILRLLTLLQIISILNNSNLELICFILTILTNFTKKLNLNRNLKNFKSIYNNISLSDFEYLNRLFWIIFIIDSLISSINCNQPNFNLNNIDLILPIAITKDEENKILIQNIIIKMSKIKSKIISNLYLINSNISVDSEKLLLLSNLRQDADIWYNECRILLSKLDLNQFTGGNSHFNLQIFAAWISQEYYYILTILFKPSNLFPKPDIPNFTVISNATFQNSVILIDLINNNSLSLSNLNLFYYKFSNISIYLLISLIKGMFTINDSVEILQKLLKIWNTNHISNKNMNKMLKNFNIYILEIEKILNIEFSKLSNNNNSDIFIPSDDSTKLILKQLKHLSNLMLNNGFSIYIDIDYINYLEIND